MPMVKLFGNLRRDAKVSQLVVPGATVRAVLHSLCADNAALSSVIFDHDQLRSYLRVLVNGRDIELARGLDTPLESLDQIAIFPPVAGGSEFPRSSAKLTFCHSEERRSKSCSSTNSNKRRRISL